MLPPSEESTDSTTFLLPPRNRSRHRRLYAPNAEIIYNRLESDSTIHAPLLLSIARLAIEGTWFLGFIALGLIAWKHFFKNAG